MVVDRRRAPKKKPKPPPEPPAYIAKIREDIERWEAGKWAEENNYGPACVCGLREEGECPRHGKRDPVG